MRFHFPAQVVLLVFTAKFLQYSDAQTREVLATLNTCCDLPMLGFDQVTCPDSEQPKIPNNSPHFRNWTVPTAFTTSEEVIEFKLVTKPLDCSKAKIITTNYQLGEKAKLMPDGYLSVGNFKSEIVEYLHKDQWCINRKIEGNEIQIKYCKSSCTESEPCVRKCCPIDYVFDPISKCVPSQNHWTPKLFHKPSDPASYTQNVVDTSKVRFTTNYVPTWIKNCNQPIFTHPYSGDVEKELLNNSNEELRVMAESYSSSNFRLSSNGKLKFRDVWRKWVHIDDNIYCVDGIQGYSNEPKDFNNTIDEDILIVCPRKLPEEREASAYYGVLAITTSMFALLTVISYFLLFDKQNIHGWTIMSHSTSVFLLFVFLGVAHLTKHQETIYGSFGCQFVASVAHYFFIGTFAWLFLISFDLWRTFRTVLAPTKEKGTKEFILYSIFGWGVPALVVCLSWILQIVYGNDPNTEIKVPDYGKSFCYISRFSLWEFLYGPIIILILLNLVFFVWTVTKLYLDIQSTKMAKENLKRNKQSFVLFIKLFLVVGLLWITEILSFSISGANVSIFWQIMDTLNTLQPVFVFIIFVLKWDVINSIYQKYPTLRPFVYPARKTLKYFRKSKSNMKSLSAPT